VVRRRLAKLLELHAIILMHAGLPSHLGGLWATVWLEGDCIGGDAGGDSSSIQHKYFENYRPKVYDPCLYCIVRKAGQSATTGG
jgi:hypothetical protein